MSLCSRDSFHLIGDENDLSPTKERPQRASTSLGSVNVPKLNVLSAPPREPPVATEPRRLARLRKVSSNPM